MDGDAIASAITLTSDGPDALVLAIPRAGQEPVRWRMTRDANAPAPSPAPAAVSESGFRAAAAVDFEGSWQALSDDETSGEFLELQVQGRELSGTLTAASQGYYSGRLGIDGEMALRGTFRNGGFETVLTDPAGESLEALLRLRGEYLIFLVNDVEFGAYARPGRPLVTSAEGSAAAEALVRAIGGRVYSSENQAAGRASFVGGRATVAFCADGRISPYASHLATAAGDIGETITRRGRWTVVLLGGAPAVRAEWEGTGSTYELVKYFRVRPAADGGSAVVDGADVPLAGSC